jgi:hypothetical protein
MLLTVGRSFLPLELYTLPVGDKQYITTKVDEESDLYRRFETYLEEAGHGNKSAATRQLVKSALDDWEEKQQPGHDPERPDTVLRALLYDADQMKHTALLISAVLATLSLALTLPFYAQAPLLVFSALYGTTSFLGFASRGLGVFAGEAADTPADSAEVEA